MKVQFEEKTYENYFNNELDSRSSIYFPLGQMQEGVLGLDSAANSKNRRLWRKFGYPFWFFPPFVGVDLKEIADEMEKIIGKVVRNIPKMKVNLLFQYKRPEYIASKLGKEWRYWNTPYFRYDLYQEQHNLLIKLESSFGRQALILYAAPAIKKIDELVKLKKHQKIIENSNFKKASELTNHDTNTYLRAGTYSIACSEPEKIENMNLLSLLESQEQYHDLENKGFIINASKRTEGVVTFKTQIFYLEVR